MRCWALLLLLLGGCAADHFPKDARAFASEEASAAHSTVVAWEAAGLPEVSAEVRNELGRMRLLYPATRDDVLEICRAPRKACMTDLDDGGGWWLDPHRSPIIVVWSGAVEDKGIASSLNGIIVHEVLHWLAIKTGLYFGGMTAGDYNHEDERIWKDAQQRAYEELR